MARRLTPKTHFLDPRLHFGRQSFGRDFIIIGLKYFPKRLLCHFLVHRFWVKKGFLQQHDNGVPVAVKEGSKGTGIARC